MVIAMIAVRKVQVSRDEVIDMVAMRNRLMTATGPMPMGLRMFPAVMSWRAGRWVRGPHSDGMLLDLVARGVMEMAIV